MNSSRLPASLQAIADDISRGVLARLAPSMENLRVQLQERAVESAPEGREDAASSDASAPTLCGPEPVAGVSFVRLHLDWRTPAGQTVALNMPPRQVVTVRRGATGSRRAYVGYAG